MSGGVTKPITARIDAILCDGYGDAGHTIPVGIFHRGDPISDSQSSAERRVYVWIMPRKNTDGFANMLDGFVLGDHPMQVEIHYVRAAGGDLVEGFGEQDGGATDNIITDRMNDDQHLIESALQWYGNWAGLDPDVWSITTTNDPQTIFDGGIAKLILTFTVSVRATNQGSYHVAS